MAAAATVRVRTTRRSLRRMAARLVAVCILHLLKLTMKTPTWTVTFRQMSVGSQSVVRYSQRAARGAACNGDGGSFDAFTSDLVDDGPEIVGYVLANHSVVAAELLEELARPDGGVSLRLCLVGSGVVIATPMHERVIRDWSELDCGVVGGDDESISRLGANGGASVVSSGSSRATARSKPSASS